MARKKVNVYEVRNAERKRLHQHYKKRLDAVYRTLAALHEDMQEGKMYDPTTKPGQSPMGVATSRRRDTLASAMQHIGRLRNGMIR